MFLLFLLIIHLYFLLIVIIAQFFIPTSELAITTEKPTKETKAEMETHPAL